jgi:hypothetical protein
MHGAKNIKIEVSIADLSLLLFLCHIASAIPVYHCRISQPVCPMQIFKFLSHSLVGIERMGIKRATVYSGKTEDVYLGCSLRSLNRSRLNKFSDR